jgi:hypothetical protein
MKQKLNELSKLCSACITKAEKASMFGVIEYLEEASANITYAQEECEEWTNDAENAINGEVE